MCCKEKKGGVYIVKSEVVYVKHVQDNFKVSYYITLIGMLACCYPVTPWTLRCIFGVLGVRTERKKYSIFHVYVVKKC